MQRAGSLSKQETLTLGIGSPRDLTLSKQETLTLGIGSPRYEKDVGEDSEMNENSPENLGEVDRLPGGCGRRRLQLPLVAVVASARGHHRERVWPSSRASALA